MSAPYSIAAQNLADAARWKVLAKQLDDPPERDLSEIVSCYVRRLEALLKDEFDASGRDLGELTDSVRSRLSRDVRVDLAAICGIQPGAADSSDRERIVALCDRAASHLLSEAADAPPTADGRLAAHQWMQRHPAIRGVVRKLRKYDDGEQHVAVMDLDGHLIELRTSKVIRIDQGDRIVLAFRRKHDAKMYYNVTKKVGFEFPSNTGMRNFLAAGAAVFIAGIAGFGVTALLAVRHIHGWADVSILLGYLVIAVPCLITAVAGFFLFAVGMLCRPVVTEFQRAVAEETDATPPGI